MAEALLGDGLGLGMLLLLPRSPPPWNLTMRRPTNCCCCGLGGTSGGVGLMQNPVPPELLRGRGADLVAAASSTLTVMRPLLLALVLLLLLPLLQLLPVPMPIDCCIACSC